MRDLEVAQMRWAGGVTLAAGQGGCHPAARLLLPLEQQLPTWCQGGWGMGVE
jgi:hypothetical protein